MARFRWRKGFESRLDAQEAGEELERLRNSRGGGITPESVVDTARSRRSPLHGHFTWDDRLAAEKHRVHEARQLIRGVMVEHPTRPQQSLIAYISVREPDRSRSYRESFAVMVDPELRAQALAECRQSINSWRKRFRNLEDIKAALDEFEEALPSS